MTVFRQESRHRTRDVGHEPGAVGRRHHQVLVALPHDRGAPNRVEGEFPRADEGEIEWRAEGTLLTRPVAEVRWMPIDAAAHRFLEACGRGQTFAQAMDAALEADAGANLVRLVTGLLDAGAFARLTPSSDDDS